ncbi:carboxypeptidase C [Malassezia equina]|uniref:Carboxypeptidase n=1 Tax=Malassezia equina TaxID=1381935 RepID=A0AAF0EHM4_9BASI|nr:carboxypeptidase C [Malassezia equina]
MRLPQMRGALLVGLLATAVQARQTPFQLTHDDSAISVLTHPSLPAYSLRLHQVPDGVCEHGAPSYSGYLDVDLDQLYEYEREKGHVSAASAASSGVVEHFYFWAFASRTHPDTDPLTLWLNGGPGCSSFTGLMMELGPCNAAKPQDGVPRTEWNPYSWVTNSSMIFLDQPVGVGFSYASWKNTSREGVPPSRIFDSAQAARDVSAFLHLLASHPDSPLAGRPQADGQRALREFHMAGESYAGRYLPLIASRVVNDNKHYAAHPEEGLVPLPLRSVLIGNGITSPRHQNRAYVEYACTNQTGHGPFLDEATCDTMWKKLPVCEDLVAKCGKKPHGKTACQTASTFCEGALSAPWEKTNTSFFDWQHGPEYEEGAYVSAFLNSEETRRHLGIDKFLIGDRHDGTFVDCSDQVYNDFASTGDGVRDSTWAVEHILENGVRVLSYSGRRDFICNYIGNGHWIEDLAWSGQQGYRDAPLEDWYVHGHKAGQFRHYGHLTYAIVDEAGHFVPLDQPSHALAMFARWIHPAGVPGRLS